MSPIQLFTDWYEEELKRSQVSIPSAVCLSTIGLDGFPNARFVSLKEVQDECFIITGPLSSRKGLEISACDKVALTFWWTETERQVRIQGTASLLSSKQADIYFADRSRESKIISIISKQGEELEDATELLRKYTVTQNSLGNEKIDRPPNWGGFSIQPFRLEFLEFSPSRYHKRQLYERSGHNWSSRELQP